MKTYKTAPHVLAYLLVTCLLVIGILCPRGASGLETISKDPYIGIIAVDADTGEVLLEENADEPAYPASVIKLMNLLLILEYAEKGTLKLDETVVVSAEASRMGGSQVYLKQDEVFTIDELLYTMIIQSANDSAVALAAHIAGTKGGFVRLMNRRAAQLGMKATTFHSVHGLPPGRGQEPDVSTAKDISILSRELLKHPAALKYTSTRERGFRNDTFTMRTHNRLLGSVQGCDGLKTGYFRAAGFSTSVTAERNGRRVVAVVMGSRARTTRDAKAREILAEGFLNLSTEPPPPPEELPAASAPAEEEGEPAGDAKKGGRAKWIVIGILSALVLFVVISWLVSRSRYEPDLPGGL